MDDQRNDPTTAAAQSLASRNGAGVLTLHAYTQQTTQRWSNVSPNKEKKKKKRKKRKKNFGKGQIFWP